MEISICFALYDPLGTYSKFVGTAIGSIFEHTKSKIKIYIQHDDSLSDINKKRFEKLANTYGQQIVFCPVFIPGKMLDLNSISTFTVGTLFRLCMADVLPNCLSKVIYLDADLLCLIDIESLWEKTFAENKLVMAVHDEGIEAGNRNRLFDEDILKRECYFNAGVMFFNLDGIRKEYDLFSESISFLQKYPYSPYPDQDALNYLFHDRVQFISDKYNRFTIYHRSQAGKEQDAIYHFSRDFPHVLPHTRFDQAFWDILIQTPWGTVENIRDEYVARLQSRNLSMLALQQAMKVSRKRKMVFWGAGGVFSEQVVSLFDLDYNQDYFIDSNLDFIGQVVYGLPVKAPSILQEEDAEKIFVIVISKSYYKEISHKLRDLKFREGIDFIDGRRLLLEEDGGY